MTTHECVPGTQGAKDALEHLERNGKVDIDDAAGASVGATVNPQTKNLDFRGFDFFT